MAKWRTYLDVTATVLMASAAGVVLWLALSPGQGRPQVQPNIPVDTINLAEAPAKGDLTAPVVLLEFSDFECQFCGAFARNVLPRLQAEWLDTGRAQLVFRHFPRDRSSTRALRSACSKDFWASHDAYFGIGAITAPALDHSILPVPDGDDGTCDARSIVERDRDIGAALGVRATPTFFIGTLASDRQMNAVSALVGAVPFERFVEALTKAAK